MLGRGVTLRRGIRPTEASDKVLEYLRMLDLEPYQDASDHQEDKSHRAAPGLEQAPYKPNDKKHCQEGEAPVPAAVSSLGLPLGLLLGLGLTLGLLLLLIKLLLLSKVYGYGGHIGNSGAVSSLHCFTRVLCRSAVLTEV